MTWEVVAVWRQPGSRIDGTVIPRTAGLHFRQTRIGAWWTATRWNRDAARLDSRYMPALRWVVRRRR